VLVHVGKDLKAMRALVAGVSPFRLEHADLPGSDDCASHLDDDANIGRADGGDIRLANGVTKWRSNKARVNKLLWAHAVSVLAVDQAALGHVLDGFCKKRENMVRFLQEDGGKLLVELEQLQHMYFQGIVPHVIQLYQDLIQPLQQRFANLELAAWYVSLDEALKGLHVLHRQNRCVIIHVDEALKGLYSTGRIAV
jgi:hypothetical protein